jgi:TPR repeat protein
MSDVVVGDRTKNNRICCLSYLGFKKTCETLHVIVNMSSLLSRYSLRRVTIRKFLVIRTKSMSVSASNLFQSAISLIDDAASHGELSPKANELLISASKQNYIPALARLGRWKLFGLNGERRNLREGLTLLQQAALQLDSSLDYEESKAAADACFQLGNAWLRMSDWVTQEDAIRASLIRAGEEPPARDSTQASSPQSESVPPSNILGDVLSEDEQKRAEAARAVIAEIKALRLKAKADRDLRGRRNDSVNVSRNVQSKNTTTDESDFMNEDYNITPLSSNEKRAYYWLFKAARSDHADAQVALGNLCMRVEPSPRVQEAVQWYEVAAQVSSESHEGTDISLNSSRTQTLPHPDALFNLGTLLWDGVDNCLPVDKAKALALFERAAAPDLQDPSALFFLGAMLHNGDKAAGVKPNVRRALRLLELAAGQGHGGACHYLSQFWRTGEPMSGIEADMKRSKHFLLQAAEEYEEPSALFELGDSFFHGRVEEGFEQDLPRALASYERAASQGHVGAAVNAGAMYFQGLGTLQSFSRALERYKFAAEQGSFEAWRNIASMHALGQGVQKSVETARGILSMIDRMEKQQGQKTMNDTVSSDAPSKAINEEAGCGKSSCGCKSKINQ